MSSSSASPARRGRPRAFDREEALDRAMRVFWAKGFGGASMSDLTAAMGIASPSLYAAFGSKEGLYREAIERYLALHKGSIDEALSLPTARESVERLLRNAVAAFSSGDSPGGCMVMQTAAETPDLSPELAASLCEARAMNEATLAARLRRGVEEGDVAPGTDIEAVADFYATVHKGLSLSARGGAGREKLESVVTSAMAAWPAVTGA